MHNLFTPGNNQLVPLMIMPQLGCTAFDLGERVNDLRKTTGRARKMEMCDVRDESGTCTGRTVARGTILRQGEYYLAIHVWIRDEVGTYLIQQRAPHLPVGPGIWATTVGYVLAGEDSLSGAIRETQEELGIRLLPTQLAHYDRLRTDDRIEDVWLAAIAHDAAVGLTLGPEVSDVVWASKQELSQMIRRGEFFPYSYFGSLPE
jgi:8-oxo-dGTP pyrophosphatase MutT (NUDIX family)